LRREPGTCGRDLVEIERCDLYMCMHMSCARMADSECCVLVRRGGRDGERELDARGQKDCINASCVCRDIEFVCRAWPEAKRHACVKERSTKLYTRL
jgi:hypothetical protein